MGDICEQTLEEVKLSRSNTDFELETIGDLEEPGITSGWGRPSFDLVVNAVIHASAKHVHIIAEDWGPDVVLRVMNRGVPIPVERQDSIFDPFVSNDHSSVVCTQMEQGSSWGCSL